MSVSSSPKPAKIKDSGAFYQATTLPPDTWETGEEDLLWLASFNPVRYEHPGIFQAGGGHVQIESGQRGDFLARLASAMGADQPRTLKTHYSRFDEYDTLARAVYRSHCQEATQQAEQERLFTVFRLRVVNADDPTACERYRYPVTGITSDPAAATTSPGPSRPLIRS
ncbi:MAG: hypothetical protein GY927_00920 [bacterium]|nr:hypothetical protein [bacterium]